MPAQHQMSLNFIWKIVRRKGLQEGSETCCDVWFGDSGADKNTGGRAGGGRDEDAQIFTE